MNEAGITTIFWDMDNTLLDFEYSMRKALQVCFETFGERLTEEMLAGYERINSTWWKRLELGQVTKKQLLNGRFVDFFAAYGLEHMDPEAFRKQFQIELGRHYSYIDHSLEVCRSLHGKVKQYVVTNGVLETQTSKIKLAGFWDLMDDIFISEVAGYEKPRKEFFQYCMERIEETDPDKILIVGDSLSSDIKGGNNAGIRTCWFNPTGKKCTEELRIDYEIISLQQIYEVIYG